MNKAACFCVEIDLSVADKLKCDLEAQEFTISQPAHTVFAAKKKGLSCTLYKSGKLTVQGKEMQAFIEFYLEPEILHEFRFSHPEAHANLEPRIGMDEAGKGDYFGPLCIAALYADENGIKQLIEWGVCDSKRLSDASIQKIAKKIRTSFAFTVIRLFPAKYNELYGKFRNLNRLLGWAHAAALGDLSQKTGCKRAILDQFADKSIVDRQLQMKKIDVFLEQRVRAEEDLVVAGASILARAAFLDGMKQLGEEHGVELPKGASNGVKATAATLVAKHGSDILTRVAKTHFKTTREVLS